MPSKKAKSAFMDALSYACRLWASRLRFSDPQAERRGGSPAARGKRSLPRKSTAVFRGGMKATAIKPPDKIETPSFSHYNDTIKQDV
jgi:hypothetical protein